MNCNPICNNQTDNIGATFQFHNYVSTSLLKERAMRYATTSSGGRKIQNGTMLLMKIPAGEGIGAYVEELTNKKGDKEFLIKRGSIFRIIAEEKEPNITTYMMEMIR